MLVFGIFSIMIPAIETKSNGFDDYIKYATRYSYLNGVVNYSVNLVIILLLVITMFVLFSVYNVFGCISIGYPLFFTVLFVVAMLSFSFLLQAIFESGKSKVGIDQNLHLTVSFQFSWH
jgi:uncharacterized membrane protein